MEIKRNKEKERIKGLVRNILASTLIASLVGIVGCAPEKEELTLPQTVNQAHSCSLNYSNSLAQAEGVMQGVFARKNFTEEEQKQVYSALNSVITNYARHQELSKRIPEGVSLAHPTNNFPWYSLLEKNVTGIDAGTPEIQKYFAGKYPGFKAASIFSPAEQETVDEALDVVAGILEVLAGD
jgi:hypothetical protein